MQCKCCNQLWRLSSALGLCVSYSEVSGLASSSKPCIFICTSIKKQLKITKVSRDGSAKKYTNKGSYGRDKVQPYNLFSSNRVSMKKNVHVGMHLVPTIATLVCILFGTTIPT